MKVVQKTNNGTNKCRLCSGLGKRKDGGEKSTECRERRGESESLSLQEGKDPFGLVWFGSFLEQNLDNSSECRVPTKLYRVGSTR